MDMFLAEIYLMAQLKHPHIVILNGIAWNTLEHVVMMKGGDLQHFLAQQCVNSSTSTAPIDSGSTVVKRSVSMMGRILQVEDSAAVASTSSSPGAATGRAIY
ncbi:hypothetical protein DD238_003349 [Peronospora effusa]|uniref:Serine-threonine/tyrosine-protein kinase catalytic domain-containing protein n=1 Tax=Peronospora effusa TaxID=542832 RepID=A0A3M6VQX3_9STRA|nr:hypothetical protein DD238_003349 [Peronospora effusa]RQM18652.1 hypothetical protein DD237_001562 [Peronospora effusa]